MTDAAVVRAIAEKTARLQAINAEEAEAKRKWCDHDPYKWSVERRRLSAERSMVQREIALLRDQTSAGHGMRSTGVFYGSNS